ncbi:MAG TPA: zf-HC2 domain-containing protein [Actinomycetota bacterium]
MTHPTEQLASYVDGSLAPDERAQVDVHLQRCAGCRGEVEDAAAARSALRSMTTPATPQGLGDPAIAEMRGKGDPVGPPGWARFTPWLAAAAVIGLLAVALPRIGSSEEDQTAASGAADILLPVAPKDIRVEIVEKDFDPVSLEAAASEFVEAARAEEGGSDGAQPVEDASSEASTVPAPIAGKAKSAAALACLRTAVPDLPGTPVRLVKASFRGTPAYLGFVLEGPGVDQPADTVSIWAVSAKHCSPLSLTSAAL